MSKIIAIRKAMPLIENIKELMKECHTSEAYLARQTGLPQSTINRMLTGLTYDPRINTLTPIAKFFGVTLEQLAGNSPLPQNRIEGSYNPVLRSAWKMVPIIEWNVAASWIIQKDNFTYNNHKDWTSCDGNISDNSFALRTLPSMEPCFRENSVIIIDPEETYTDGSFILVSKKLGQDFVVRKIQKDGADVYLKSIIISNKLEIMKDTYSIIGVIVETKINERKTLR